jgi:lipoprotein-anchoring transpeptidase ErfK/SrfK
MRGRMRRSLLRAGGAAAIVIAGATAASVRADAPAPPWFDPGEPPPPAWARSVAPKTDEQGHKGDLVAYIGPNRASGRRGVTLPGTSLPFFGEKRGSGCSGRWWLVGPLAWACSDDAELSPNEPQTVGRGAAASETVGPSAADASREPPREQYYFVQSSGTSGYASLQSAEEGTEDRQLEGGWAVGVVDQQTMNGERWALTSKGLWIAARDLIAARPSSFHGELLARQRVDVAWVLADRANVWSTPDAKKKPVGTLAHFDHVAPRDRAPGDASAAARPAADELVQIDDDAWVQSRDLARPSVVPPPPELGPDERWIDVDTATQTLVAYDGTRPYYATLVSTGRGGAGSPTATPLGVHRIWVKLLATDMDNVEREDVDQHYSMQDVPYVQFFDGAVGLHGTYWHHDFGHVHSHGCVNLSPADAAVLFAFTSPSVPSGWAAVYPTALSRGTLVRVR